jgi:hypothetical protein
MVQGVDVIHMRKSEKPATDTKLEKNPRCLYFEPGKERGTIKKKKRKREPGKARWRWRSGGGKDQQQDLRV